MSTPNALSTEKENTLRQSLSESCSSIFGSGIYEDDPSASYSHNRCTGQNLVERCDVSDTDFGMTLWARFNVYPLYQHYLGTFSCEEFEEYMLSDPDDPVSDGDVLE